MEGAAIATTPWQRRAIVASIMLATLLQTVDMTIANVALPHMQGALSATLDQVAWVLTSYIVASAIMTPPAGVLADLFGRKRVMLISVVGFTIASMLCGMAGSVTEMVVFRLFQGALGAALIPLSQATLMSIYPPAKYGQAMAMWALGVMVGPIIGPTLGGFLTEAYSWRWVFFINVPVGILATVAIAAAVPRAERDRSRRFDVFGFALLSIAIGALQLMLDRGGSEDWFTSAEIVIEAAVSAVFFYMFVAHMFTSRAPFIEPGLFKDRNLSIGLLFGFIIGIVVMAVMSLWPPLLQNLMGYTVLDTGFTLAPRGAGVMLGIILMGRLSTKLDLRFLILFGFVLMAISLWWMAQFTLEVENRMIVAAGLLQGVGIGFVFVPVSTVAFQTLVPRYRNEAASMFNLIRNIGSSIGISILMTRLADMTQTQHAVLSESVTPFRDAFRLPQVQELWNLHQDAGLAALNQEVTRQASFIAYLTDFKLVMWMTLLAIPLLLLFRRGKGAPKPAPAAE